MKFAKTLVYISLVFSSTITALKAEENKDFVNYQNQLIKENVDNYSTLTNKPLKAGALNGLDLNPFVLHSIDGKELENLSLFAASGFRDYTQTYLKIKIPPGIHKIVVRGGGFKSFKLTDMGNINFEPGKNYITAASPNGNNAFLSIYEYEEDERFPLLDPDRYVLKKRVSNPAQHGNLK